MDIVKQLSGNPLVISAVLALFGYLWHRVTTSSAAQSTAVSSVIAAMRSAFASVVATVAPTISPSELQSQLYAIAKQQLAAVGIDESKMPPMVAALINAAIHDAIDSFVSQHKDPRSLAAVVSAVSMSPIAQAH